jgi:hypothetical protein
LPGHWPGQQERHRQHHTSARFLQEDTQSACQKIEHLGLDLFTHRQRLRFGGLQESRRKVEVAVMLDQRLHDPNGRATQPEWILRAGRRQPGAEQPYQRIDSVCERKRQSHRSAQQRKQQAFCCGSAKEPCPCCSKCDANGLISGAGSSAHQKEIGDIDADHQQDCGGYAQQHHQTRTDLVHQIFTQSGRTHFYAVFGFRIFFPQAIGDDIQLALRL